MTAETSHPQHDITSPGDLARCERDLKIARSVDGEVAQAVIDSLADISPTPTHHITAFGSGGVYPRPGLDPHNRQPVTIDVLMALGGYKPQLRIHIGATLNVGLTREGIVEAILRASVYAGFPQALNVTFMVREVFTERDVAD